MCAQAGASVQLDGAVGPQHSDGVVVLLVARLVRLRRERVVVVVVWCF